jgi:hypothetical protein|tara:strand:+ start:398 stop:607 length:210 start_codon:yes stop_codon:yes gene_type:complete
MDTILVRDTPTKIGKQNRARNSASISVSWEVYDKLIKLAGNEKATIGRVVEGLCRIYAEIEETTEKKHA